MTFLQQPSFPLVPRILKGFFSPCKAEGHSKPPPLSPDPDILKRKPRDSKAGKPGKLHLPQVHTSTFLLCLKLISLCPLFFVMWGRWIFSQQFCPIPCFWALWALQNSFVYVFLIIPGLTNKKCKEGDANTGSFFSRSHVLHQCFGMGEKLGAVIFAESHKQAARRGRSTEPCISSPGCH